MKNVYSAIVLSLLFVVFSVDAYIQEQEYGQTIHISEVVENSTGLPCLDCECNLSIYFVNGTFNSSYILDNQGTGIYNTTIGNMETNAGNEAYPVLLRCNTSTYYGVSDLEGIRVIPTAFDFTALSIIMVAIPFLFAYLALRLEPSDPIKVWMKWIYICVAIVFLMVDLGFAVIISGNSGIASLPDFFGKWIYIVGIIFIMTIVGLIWHISFVKTKIAKANNND